MQFEPTKFLNLIESDFQEHGAFLGDKCGLWALYLGALTLSSFYSYHSMLDWVM